MTNSSRTFRNASVFPKWRITKLKSRRFHRTCLKRALFYWQEQRFHLVPLSRIWFVLRVCYGVLGMSHTERCGVTRQVTPVKKMTWYSLCTKSSRSVNKKGLFVIPLRSIRQWIRSFYQPPWYKFPNQPHQMGQVKDAEQTQQNIKISFKTKTIRWWTFQWSTNLALTALKADIPTANVSCSIKGV